MTLGLYRTRWVMLSYSPFPRKKLRFSSRIWDNWWANGHFVCKVLHDTHAFSFLLLPFSIRSTNRRLLSVCVGFLWAGCWDWAVPTSKQNSLSSGNLSCRCVTAGDTRCPSVLLCLFFFYFNYNKPHLLTSILLSGVFVSDLVGQAEISRAGPVNSLLLLEID